ncbi:cytochrome c-type biogenesis protein CcmH [Chloroflexi bacterium TSY]|nr:cytochrome c-type biogenesis protein CcmH [Chloroflexi bacterium TSY]
MIRSYKLHKPIRKYLAIGILLLLLVRLILVSTLYAQDSSSVSSNERSDETTTQESSEGQTSATLENNGVSNDEIYRVAQELWCPLCSGVRLDSCELQACVQMREEIALKLSEGADQEAIVAYFVDVYGPQVLGEPPRSGFNLLAWVVPFLALGLAGVILLLRNKQLLSFVRAVPSSTAQDLSAINHSSSDDRTPETDLRTTPNDLEVRGDEQDKYEQQLEQELSKFN